MAKIKLCKQNNQTQNLRWDLDKPASWYSWNRPNENKADSINVDFQTFIQHDFNTVHYISMSTYHAQLLFVTKVTLSGFVTENLSVLSAQQTLQVRGHFSFAPVQALHLSHLFFLLTLQNVKWKRWWVSWMNKESIPWQKSNFVNKTIRHKISAEISINQHRDIHGIVQMKIKRTVSTSTSKHSYNMISIRSIIFLWVLTMRNFCLSPRLLCQVLWPRIYQYYQRKQLALESSLLRNKEEGSSQCMIRVHAIQISFCMFVF